MAEHDGRSGSTRRQFMQAAGLGALALGLGGAAPADASAHGKPTGGKAGPGPATAPGQPYNILFLLTDQERFFRKGELPPGFSLPAHERLAKRGVTFANHRINSCVCTPSRSVLYTGRHIQQTRMFDNTNFPWIDSLAPDVRTVGHLLREAGYYTAYKGKWHLTKEFETVNELGTPTRIFTKEMEGYGFSDYVGIGDIIAHVQGGWLHDGITSAMAGSWLRGKGRELGAAGKPWFLAVNLVNPHDVMFFDTDAPGTPLREAQGLSPLARAPLDPLYAKRWPYAAPRNHAQALDAPGRPRAHADFLRSHDALVGPIADEPERWQRRHDYYLNCLRDADRNIGAVLDELERSGQADRTIVVLTADHGDLDGAHRLHAKGATAYREQNHVPLIVAHPAFAGGKTCRALTSQLDLAPTLLAFTGAAPERRQAIGKDLPGKDFSGVLAAPEQAGVDAVRGAALFNYNMFAYVDGDYLMKAVQHLRAGGKPKELKADGIVPDLSRRGAMRSVFDGRHVFTRYFSPKQHNRPTTLETLTALNDLELFDTQADPLELTNLAASPRPPTELLLAMNDNLNELIDLEVGEDRGQMLPGGIEAGWEVTPETMAP
ncbi:MAG: sulfatase-like hydrolase/transferase [Anaeromyxobacter sp.]